MLAGALAQHLGWLLWCGLCSSFAIGLVNLRTITRAPDGETAGLQQDEV